MTRTTRRSFARRLAGGALTVVAGLGGVAVSGSPAMAASCSLDFIRVSQTVYQIALNCGDATPGVVALWAEDFPFDEFLGNHYRNGSLVDQGILDEDDIPFNREDEIHAVVTVTEPDGSADSVRTNTVHRNF